MSGKVQRPKLDDVTLVAVTSVALSATVAALRRSLEQCEFEKALILSDRRPEGEPQGIEWRKIDRLASRADYSRFMLQSLADHIETSHALCVQWDGFVLNGPSWRTDFLEYDYIGAVWPHFADNRVGNGGFSLRSRKLLKASKALPFVSSEAEDLAIGRRCRPQLEKRGIRFAPESVARAFAYERTKPTGQEFGFHGAYNMVRYLPRSEADQLFGRLETGMLAPNERSELLRWALVRGRLRLAKALWDRR